MSEETAAVKTTEITIQGLVFVIPQPYGEGHVLTANEAAALNQVYGENLRNNFAKRVKDAIEKAGSAEATDRASLQADLDAYSEEYEFGVRRVASTRSGSLDPVAAEAEKMAKELIKNALKAQGYKVSDVDAEQMAKLVEGLLEQNPSIREEAARRVETAKTIGKDVLKISLGAKPAGTEG